MLVSIVTPVLNGMPYLPSTLASIAGQSYDDWELIVVDGGSDDGSLEIVRDFAEREPRCRLLVGKDRGMYDAVFRGFEHARGSLLTWINADDMLMPWAVATAVEQASAGHHWLCGLPAVCDHAGRIRYVEANNWYPRWAVRRGWMHGGCMSFIQQEGVFFSRQLLAKLSPSTVEAIRASRLCGDTLLWAALAQQQSLLSLPVPLACFRRHGDNRSLRGYADYLAELRGHRFPSPPRPLARSIRWLYVIAGTMVTRYRLRRWHVEPVAR